MKRYALILGLSLIATLAQAQPFSREETYSRQDTLRGSIGPERAWWDLVHYKLSVWVYPEKEAIEGVNTVTYTVVSASPGRMQIDLQEPMQIEQVMQNGKALTWVREGSAYFINVVADQPIGSRQQIAITWGGVPQKAKRAPWDGGFTWTTSKNGMPFIATANQGDGASVWWPCKDHPADEPQEGVIMAVTVPEDLVHVGNGRLISNTRNKRDKTRTYTWEVTNPINSYAININVGDYVNFNETYEGEKGTLTCSYWVLKEDEAKARAQFPQALKTLEAMEWWLGPYPFYEDTYKLVQAPYLGMEHQSSVTYGNGFMNGYRGTDLSQTGEGLKFDFIIIHESAHEWFANSITSADVADMWVHEGFTDYAESLYLEYHFGKESAWRYVRGLRTNIQNDIPIIGTYGVNREGSSDMYYKGSNMLHTLRMIVNDDEKWRAMLRGIQSKWYHQIVTSAEIEAYLAEQSGEYLEPFFDVYLRDTRIPTLTYRKLNGALIYKWTNVPQGFIMPVDVTIDGEPIRLVPTEKMQYMEAEVSLDSEFIVNPNYYIAIEDQTVK